LNSNISFSAASRDYHEGRYTHSLEKLNQLIDMRKDAKTFALLAKTLLKLGLKTNAAVAFELAGKFEGSNQIEYLREAIKLQYECGNEENALRLGTLALPIARSDLDIIYVLTAIHAKNQNYDVMRPYLKMLSDSNQQEHYDLVCKLLIQDWRDDEVQLELVRNLFKRYPQNHSFRFFYLMYARDRCQFDSVTRHHRPIALAVAKRNLKLFDTDIPFYNIHWCADEEINFHATGAMPLIPEGATAKRRNMPHQWAEKIRVGYVSNDLWEDHATMKLIQSIFELHDKERFEVTLFCHTSAEHLRGADRSRWGNVIQVGHLSYDEAADAIREQQIDILIDLKGHTKGTRNQIFNRTTAPIHVAWLGYPGSTVNIDLDYIIGDRFVLPESSKPFYHEKFCLLPETYQPNDPYKRPLPKPLSRAELGLPDDKFIFSSFNNSRKITAETIDLWFSILKKAKNSILWLMARNAETEANIMARAKTAGISTKRILFTRMVKYEAHMDRMPLADLALDTFPVNGHTTTSDQLWAGLPVLTVKGTHFASRVSESLLNAIGLPELVMPDLKAYEEMAIALYEDRNRLAGYRQKLIDNRFTMPLFDAERFRQHLETSYEMMVERAKQGLEPDHFDVPAMPPRTGPFHG
jgi:predicted O-linked N-acetylglucosamine transferase (SPINDLY family)